MKGIKLPNQSEEFAATLICCRSSNMKKHKRTRSPAQLEEKFRPLQCNPQNLWHLRFEHSSVTMLQKLKSIKSNFDSSTCHVCIRTKQAKKPYYPVKEKTKRKLEQLHSDLCRQYPESKGNSI